MSSPKVHSGLLTLGMALDGRCSTNEDAVAVGDRSIIPAVQHVGRSVNSCLIKMGVGI